MSNTQIGESLQQKRDRYLEQAIDAESNRDFVAAGRFFKYAMYCEARIHLDKAEAKKHVEQAGPLYKPIAAAAGI